MSTITARPWKLLKCPCGHPSCQQYQFTNQGSYGLDKDDAEFALRAINAFDTMERAAKAAKEVMTLLDEHGASIVPHLLDSDENPGQRLRDAIVGVEASLALSASEMGAR
ncbi:hypothetical protein [Chelatococcus sp. XZ-Ab1]|uniref:hypothetical protein n=1 Tax=Chelatococcus sp. XZ-Ab1 TaxID=3034027 RepID=UPI0023E442CD|nr:hypothetical protein [Chelatococcus sp. XZ-Ab1]